MVYLLSRRREVSPTAGHFPVPYSTGIVRYEQNCACPSAP
jgi:hypothetical protein